MREHRAEEAREGLRIGLFRRLIIADRLRGKEARKHRTDPVDGIGHSRLRGLFFEASRRLRAQLFQTFIGAGPPQNLHRLHSRRHGQRISRERAGLIDRPKRRKLLHDFRRAAESAHRQTAADDLPQRRQIRLNTEKFLCAAVGHAEPSDDLVENQQRSLLRRQLPQLRQVAGLRRYASHIAGNRLDQRAGDFISVLLEGLFQCGNIVERHRERQLGQRLRDAGAVGQSQRGDAGAGLGQERIAVAVVATLKF